MTAIEWLQIQCPPINTLQRSRVDRHMRLLRTTSDIREVNTHTGTTFLAELVLSQFGVPTIRSEALLKDLGCRDPFDIFMEGIDVQIAIDVTDRTIAVPHLNFVEWWMEKSKLDCTTMAGNFVLLKLFTMVVVWIEKGWSSL